MRGMKHQPLIGSAELDALQRSEPERVIVFDCSFELLQPKAGRALHEAAHLPGAHYLHLDEDLSALPNGRNGRHPLPARAAFAAAMAARGVGEDSRVIVYDGVGNAYAARAWWMLRWIGHADVAVLDGGLAAWQAAGLPIAQGPTAPATARTLPPRPALVAAVDRETLLANLDGGPLLVLDGRSNERFTGANDTIEKVVGHIPGSRNRFFRDNLDESGCFKAGARLRAEFEALTQRHPTAQLVMSCGSGVTACHNLLALELAGLQGAALYPGSWSEWSSWPGAPVALGDD
ncbi:MAG: 3-mercaptopyruvate sulfurtransferase [Rubrivivax sp. SCN 71-131]|nr:MAG: 3-mercaptopyruvate sulfurtransferase [Rubrivivax sp. SCN 71-131]